MQNDLEKLSKPELIALVQEQQAAQSEAEKQQEGLRQEKVDLLAHQAELQAYIDQLTRMLYGQKRERFVAPKGQLPLPFGPSEEQAAHQEAVLEEKVSYTRKRHKKAHPGRAPLPDHLPVKEIEIHPEGDLSGMVCIGKEITEELECIPEQFYINRYIRYKYAPKSGEGSHQVAPLPSRVIDKGIPGAGLLAMLLVNKYVDHLPLYRQRQRFLRQGIDLKSATINGWVKQGSEKLEILYERLRLDIQGRGYLQVDESPIKVLASEKKGACHQGYYWVYHDPIAKNVLFDYQAGRGYEATEGMLVGFTGYLQSDGYGVYEKVAKKEKLVHLACLAHVRREFDKALKNDPRRAQTALLFIQQLYQVEEQARKEQLSASERKERRLQEALPIWNRMGKWLRAQVGQLLPRSQIGKAFAYTIKRWDLLQNYLLDGHLEIDNNLTENAIRPLALGRKNYLFAGSHDAARRAAVMYSFFAICKKHQVNPHEWLKHVLVNIWDTPVKKLDQLYPQHFRKAQK